jgi:hypothetical protein
MAGCSNLCLINPIPDIYFEHFQPPKMAINVVSVLFLLIVAITINLLLRTF